MPAITVDRLTKRYGATTAVDDLSFTVPAGTVTGFLGPNGAGKSTTLRMLLGLTRPTSGTARIGDRGYGDLDDPFRTVGAMLETEAFHPGRKGRDHLRVLATAAGLPIARVDEVLEVVGLADAAGRRVGGYSLGMRQRLGLAAALLGEPDVLLLDEPANGLDPQGIRWLRDLLRHFAAAGATVLVSSHVLSEVALIAEQVVVIAEGRLVAHGSVAEITAPTSAAVTVGAEDPLRLAEALRRAGAEVDVLDAADRLTVRGVDARAVGAAALSAGVVLTELTPSSVSLEDVFLELTGSAAPHGAPDPLAPSSAPKTVSAR